MPSKQLQGINGDFNFEFVNDWYEYQCDFVNNLDTRDYYDKVIYKDNATVSEVIIYKNKELIKENSEVVLYGNKITFEDDSGVPTRFFSPPGQKKHPTGRPLTYATDVNPLAGPFWTERMKADHINDIVREAKNATGIK